MLGQCILQKTNPKSNEANVAQPVIDLVTEHEHQVIDLVQSIGETRGLFATAAAKRDVKEMLEEYKALAPKEGCRRCRPITPCKKAIEAYLPLIPDLAAYKVHVTDNPNLDTMNDESHRLDERELGSIFKKAENEYGSLRTTFVHCLCLGFIGTEDRLGQWGGLFHAFRNVDWVVFVGSLTNRLYSANSIRQYLCSVKLFIGRYNRMKYIAGDLTRKQSDDRILDEFRLNMKDALSMNNERRHSRDRRRWKKALQRHVAANHKWITIGGWAMVLKKVMADISVILKRVKSEPPSVRDLSKLKRKLRAFADHKCCLQITGLCLKNWMCLFAKTSAMLQVAITANRPQVARLASAQDFCQDDAGSYFLQVTKEKKSCGAGREVHLIEKVVALVLAVAAVANMFLVAAFDPSGFVSRDKRAVHIHKVEANLPACSILKRPRVWQRLIQSHLAGSDHFFTSEQNIKKARKALLMRLNQSEQLLFSVKALPLHGRKGERAEQSRLCFRTEVFNTKFDKDPEQWMQYLPCPIFKATDLNECPTFMAKRKMILTDMYRLWREGNKADCPLLNRSTVDMKLQPFLEFLASQFNTGVTQLRKVYLAVDTIGEKPEHSIGLFDIGTDSDFDRNDPIAGPVARRKKGPLQVANLGSLTESDDDIDSGDDQPVFVRYSNVQAGAKGDCKSRSSSDGLHRDDTSTGESECSDACYYDPSLFDSSDPEDAGEDSVVSIGNAGKPSSQSSNVTIPNSPTVMTRPSAVSLTPPNQKLKHRFEGGDTGYGCNDPVSYGGVRARKRKRGPATHIVFE